MGIYIAAFISGVLTILAPCVLPVLPVIIGSWLVQDNKKKILVIVLSFALSIIAFTLLLKVSVLCTGVQEQVRKNISGIILVILWIVTIFPNIRYKIAQRTKLDQSSWLATRAKNIGGFWGNVLLGASLWPIFASCSPTYGLIIAIILPATFAKGLISIVLYALGLSLMLALLALGGNTIVRRYPWLADPYSWLRKVIGILVVLTGIAIITSYDKYLSEKILDAWFFDVTKIEQQVLDFFVEAEPVPEQQSFVKYDVEINQSLFNANFTAPAFTGLGTWINTTWFASMESLRGKVVLIDFWTYSCINCVRTVPYLQKWHEMYADKWLVILGVHAPEFAFERETKNVLAAVQKLGIRYPVVQDNNFGLWKAYNNRYRPAKYIVDVDGNVRYYHFGEWAYEETELVIQELLKTINGEGRIPDTTAAQQVNPTASPNDNISQETYLGLSRRLLHPEENAWFFIKEDQNILHTRWLDGERKASDEKISLVSGKGSIFIRAYAQKVFLVSWAKGKPVQWTIYVDGIRYAKFEIGSYDMYTMLDLATAEEHKIQIEFNQPGVEAYAFTFW